MVISKNPVTCRELLKVLPHLFLESETTGDLDRHFHSVGAPDTHDATAAVCIANPKALREAQTTPACVLVVGRKLRAQLGALDDAGKRTVLVSPNPELAMAMMIKTFFLPTPYTNRTMTGVHPTAVISANTELASDVRIGPNAFIGAGVKLAAGVYVGANAVIEDASEIGEGKRYSSLVFIGHSTLIGKNCEVHPNAVVGKEGFGYAHDEKGNHHRIPHQGRVVLEDDVHIGACCTIDRATMRETRIRKGAKFDNKVHIGHNGDIGSNSLITAGFLLAGSSKIGANFVTGGNTVVSGHLEVCDNVQLAASSVVRKGIDKPGAYGGSPLVPLSQYTKMMASLAHLFVMRKQLKLVMRKLGLEDTGE